MARRPSLAMRAAIAVALMFGFYALALTIAGLLLYLPYTQIVHMNRIFIKPLIACIGGACLILWSILPRIDRFEAPGPEVTATGQPGLFQLIHEVAEAAGQQPPAHVYVTLEVNAWVTERGGMMGFGSRRVMGIGLPLLQGLTVDELRAVIAHEFGHYVGGDTKLGPWVYKTRGAIERSLENLDESGWLRMPFVGYAKLFLRVTNSVSRQEEYAADQLAARIAGGEAVRSGLQKLGGLPGAFSVFWQNEYAPLLSTAHRAPLAGGFAAYLSAPDVVKILAAISAEELLEGTSSPYDSHPSTASRCEAVAQTGAGMAPQDPRPATELLVRIEELESEVLAACVSEEIRSFAGVEWAAMPESVWVKTWRDQVGAQGEALEGTWVAELGTLAGDPSAIAEKIRFEPGYLPDTEAGQARALRLLGTALGVALHNGGWSVAGAVGEPLTFQKGGETIQPLQLVRELASEEDARAGWADRAAQLGLANTPLYTGAAAPAA
jgi:heat shock protein HtpX